MPARPAGRRAARRSETARGKPDSNRIGWMRWQASNRSALPDSKSAPVRSGLQRRGVPAHAPGPAPASHRQTSDGAGSVRSTGSAPRHCGLSRPARARSRSATRAWRRWISNSRAPAARRACRTCRPSTAVPGESAIPPPDLRCGLGGLRPARRSCRRPAAACGRWMSTRRARATCSSACLPRLFPPAARPGACRWNAHRARVWR